MPDATLTRMTACEAVLALRNKDVRPSELVEASIARIEADAMLPNWQLLNSP